MFADKQINMIPVAEDMSHIYQINKALADGNIISIPGDRVFGSPREMKIEFMGATAAFPLGPFAIARQRNTGMIAVFVMKDSMYKYRIIVKPIKVPTGTSNAEKVTAMATQFAGCLEDILHLYPEQWFNYYKFWINE